MLLVGLCGSLIGVIISVAYVIRHVLAWPDDGVDDSDQVLALAWSFSAAIFMTIAMLLAKGVFG